MRYEWEGRSSKEMSPSFFAKSFDVVYGKVVNVRKIMDRMLLVKADKSAETKLLKCKSLDHIPAAVEPHKSINLSRV